MVIDSHTVSINPDKARTDNTEPNFEPQLFLSYTILDWALWCLSKVWGKKTTL